MESANLHQLQNQLHLVGSSSSSSSSSCSSLDNNTDPSFFGVSSSQWSPGGMSLKNVSLSHNYNNEMLKRIHENNNKNNNTSEYMNLSNIQIQQDLPLQWPYEQSSYDLHEGIHKIKEEIYSSTTSNHHQIHQQNMPKFTNMLNIPEITDDTKIGENKDFNDVEAKELLLKTISSGFPINGNYSSNYPSSSLSQSLKGVFSQIHPSVNISSLPESRKMNMETNMRHIPRPFDMNMEMFNGRILEGNVLNSQDISNLVMLRGSLSPYGLPFHQHLQQTLHQNPSSSLSSPTHHMEMLSNDREASEGKMQNVSKKPRVEPRSSCPPFKVRKEKLGDRIAALQQLVSPFGKTDTASVLMEAIGYINFLHNQIETLSVPYMRASRNRTGKASQEESLSQEGEEEESGDLRSRGLCLVPISCMTYVTGDGSGLWPAKPDFGGEI